MNHLGVSANFEPGHVEVSTLHRNPDGKPFAVIGFDACDGPYLSVYLDDLAQVDEWETALAQARTYLTNELAASDAA